MQVRDTGSGNGARTVDPTAGRADLPPPPAAGPTQVHAQHRAPTTGEYPLASAGRSMGDPGGLRLEPPSAAPRRRLPELVLGIFLVAGCALAAVLLAAAGRERTPALALADNIQRGDIIDESDLNTIYIGSDSDLAYVSPADMDLLVNHAARSDLPAGALVTPDQFVDPAAVLGPGQATIGLSLESGQLPSLNLAPGDRVTVVAGGGTASANQAEIVADGATVESVTEISDQAGQQPRWWVSLVTSEAEATALAMANANNARVQLVMVER